jgi:hypothetical protein
MAAVIELIRPDQFGFTGILRITGHDHREKYKQNAGKLPYGNFHRILFHGIFRFAKHNYWINAPLN